MSTVQRHMTNDSAENMSHVSLQLSALSGRQTAGNKEFLHGFAITLPKVYTCKKHYERLLEFTQKMHSPVLHTYLFVSTEIFTIFTNHSNRRYYLAFSGSVFAGEL
jgi:hypothetical protein